ncbi:hypothetical protein Tco_1233360, partial [Tanacetum coccineum]
DGSYVEDASRDLVVKANKEISRKISELGCPEEEIDNEKRAAIDRDVWIDIEGLGGEALGYGARNQKLESQTKKVEELENTIGGFRDELKLFQTMFRMRLIRYVFQTQVVSYEGY